MAKASSKPVRDQLVDAVGYVGDVVKLLKEPAVEAVKAHLARKKAVECVGDTFGAQLIGTGKGVEVDAAKFVELYSRGKISKADLAATITVSVTKARELLSAADFERVTIEKDAPKQLRPYRLIDAPADLHQALSFLRDCQVKQDPPAASAA